MVGTFIHVAKNDGILGLYSGVCESQTWGGKLDWDCGAETVFFIAIRSYSAPINLLDHAIRNLRRTQGQLHITLPTPRNPDTGRNGLHLRLPRWCRRKPRGRPQRTHAIRRRAASRATAQLQKRPPWAGTDDSHRGAREFIPRRVAQLHSRRVDDGLAIGVLR